VIEEERTKQDNLTDALVREQHNTESYIKELEQEKLRSVQLKDRTGHVIQVQHVIFTKTQLVDPQLFLLGNGVEKSSLI
jgi:hypothetical protein